MATIILVVKILPDSPDANLEAIKNSVRTVIEKEGGKGISFEEKPIGFGLKALMLKTTLPEEKGTDFVEQEISKIEHVSSIIIEDYRRAFG